MKNKKKIKSQFQKLLFRRHVKTRKQIKTIYAPIIKFYVLGKIYSSIKEIVDAKIVKRPSTVYLKLDNLLETE